MNSTQVLILCILVYFAITNKSKDTRNVLLVVAGLLLFCMMDLKEGYASNCENAMSLPINERISSAAPQCYKFRPEIGKHYTIYVEGDISRRDKEGTTLEEPKIILSRVGEGGEVLSETSFDAQGVAAGGYHGPFISTSWTATAENVVGMQQTEEGNSMNIRVESEKQSEKPEQLAFFHITISERDSGSESESESGSESGEERESGGGLSAAQWKVRHERTPPPSPPSPQAGGTCIAPSQKDGYVIPKRSASGTWTGGQCAEGYFGNMKVTCSSQGGELSLSGCTPCRPVKGYDRVTCTRIGDSRPLPCLSFASDSDILSIPADSSCQCLSETEPCAKDHFCVADQGCLTLKQKNDLLEEEAAARKRAVETRRCHVSWGGEYSIVGWKGAGDTSMGMCKNNETTLPVGQTCGVKCDTGSDDDGDGDTNILCSTDADGVHTLTEFPDCSASPQVSWCTSADEKRCKVPDCTDDASTPYDGCTIAACTDDASTPYANCDDTCTADYTVQGCTDSDGHFWEFLDDCGLTCWSVIAFAAVVRALWRWSLPDGFGPKWGPKYGKPSGGFTLSEETIQATIGGHWERSINFPFMNIFAAFNRVKVTEFLGSEAPKSTRVFISSDSLTGKYYIPNEWGLARIVVLILDIIFLLLFAKFFFWAADFFGLSARVDDDEDGE